MAFCFSPFHNLSSTRGSTSSFTPPRPFLLLGSPIYFNHHPQAHPVHNIKDHKRYTKARTNSVTAATAAATSTPPPFPKSNSSLSSSPTPDIIHIHAHKHKQPPNLTRRQAFSILVKSALAVFLICFTNSIPPTYASLTLRKSKEEILEERRKKREEEMTEEEIEAEKQRILEEKQKRIEKQKALLEQRQSGQGIGAIPEKDIEANLRGNYYYPTARKRYLPRIKRCADEIPKVMQQIQDKQWDNVAKFVSEIAADTIGPMKLYASSLTGQGLSLSIGFVKEMTDQTEIFENQTKLLEKAVKKKDQASAMRAYQAMAQALEAYRVAAKINTPDGGVGDFPQDRKIGSGMANNNPALYKRNLENIK